MILVAGEALIDLFVGTPHRIDGPRENWRVAGDGVAGGSNFNVAIGVARLGAACGFLGGLSTDGFGRFLAERLQAEGVEIVLGRRSNAPSPLAVISTAPDGQPTYSFHARDCAETDVLPDDLPADLGGVEAIALGSFSLALEPVGGTLERLATREGASRVISLDPNLRPALIPDLAAWRSRFCRLVRAATIVKASREDIALAYGADADAEQIVGGWLDRGARLVVLTDGPNGALAYRESGRLHVPARAVEVVDTVGAGDTFHAALLVSLQERGMLARKAIAGLDDETLMACLSRAAAAAALTCSRRGADIPNHAELDAFVAGAAL